MPSTKPLVTLVMEPALIERIDDFRFAQRFPSRAATIKWLLTWALDQQLAMTREAERGEAETGQMAAAA